MTKSRVAIFITLVQVILFLAYFLVYKMFTIVFAVTSPAPLFWTRIIFFILSVSFMLATIFNYRFYGSFGRALYRFTSIALGFFYWLLFASLGSAVVYIVYDPLTPAVGQILMFGALLTGLYGLINGHSTRITNLKITIPNLPKSWQGKKAVLIADTHFGSYWNLSFAKKIVKMINSQNPDIVFFSGDFYDGPPADYDSVAAPFSQIKAPWGVFFAPGNHEEFSDPKPYFQAISHTGIKVLNNEKVLVNGVQILGVGFGAAHRKEQEQGVLKNLKVNENIPSILLKHEPSNVDVAAENGISLQLSGHTHLGQMWPLNYITKKVYGKFHTGLNSLGATQVYTTTGAGAWGPPQRVGNRPEIVAITFD